MTKLKLSLTIALLLLASASLMAEPTVIRTHHLDKNKTPIPIKDKNKIKPDGTSLLDSNAQCYYLDGRLFFSFMRSEGNAKVSVISAQIGKEYTMTALSLYPFSISVGDFPGYYLITLTTAKGSQYTGEYIIEN